MPSAILVHLAIGILIAGSIIAKGGVLKNVSANSIHAFLLLRADPWCAIAGSFIVEVDFAHGVGAGLAWAGVVVVFSIFSVEPADVLTHRLLPTSFEQVLVALLFLKFEVDGDANRLSWCMELLDTLPVLTSFSVGTYNSSTKAIIFDASPVKALLSLFALYIHAFSNAGRNTALLVGLYLGNMVALGSLLFLAGSQQG